MKNINVSTMESNILDQFAAFDIKAKIEVSIYFEDEDEDKEVAIKTENFADVDNINSQDRTNLPLHCSEPKLIIKEEVPETTDNKIDDEVNGDKHIDEQIPKEITTLETENLQNKTKNSDNERKRKQKLLQIYKNKRVKIDSPPENVTNGSSNENKENNVQKSVVSNPNCTHRDVDTSQLNLNEVPSAAAIPTSNKNNEESEKYKIRSRILSYLTAVSENMRLVMEAYAYHREYNTPYDSYKKQKIHYFNNSYDTVTKLILPETHNKGFILSFLQMTYQHALKRPALNKFCLRDYEILLKELLSWAKKKQDLSQTTKNTIQTGGQQENTVQPSLASSNYSQAPILENSPNKPEVNSTTKSDTICIFSIGSPGSEISINVDPKLSSHLLTANNLKKHDAQTKKKSSIDFQRAQVPFQTHPETQSTNLKNNETSVAQIPFQKYPDTRPNNINNNEASVAQTSRKSSVDLSRAQIPFEAYPDTRPENNEAAVAQTTRKSSLDLAQAQITFQTHPATRPSYTNNHEASVAQSTRKSIVDLPRAQMPFQTQPGTEAINKYTYLQELLQQPPSIPPSFPDIQSRLYPEMYKYMQTTTCVVQKYSANNDTIQKQTNTSARLPQKPLEMQNENTMIDEHHLPAKSMPPPWILNQKQQSVNTAQKQSVLASPSYDQPIRLPPPPYATPIWSQQQVQPELVNYQHIQPHYDQSRQIQQLSPLKHMQRMLPQYRPYQQIQSQIRLSQNTLPQNGYPTRQPQSIMPQHVYPQIPVQSPAQAECEKRLQVEEWHQGLNELYHQGQIHQQSQKNAPRSTSTDSGFISPLNFNAADQTVPPVPEHTESSQIVITHVTSLNPNVPSMAEGSCVMCNTTTKKVCMGCMKVYYCTYECQLQDWSKHGPNCQNSASRQH